MKPKLVSSGGFRIDRAKALEKLREFQTPDPELFMLPWIRAAVAGGAKRISLDLARTGDFTMSFDGAPVRPDAADPSVALFGVNPDPRVRFLAIGILAALRLKPKLVTLASGSGKERRCLRLGMAGDSFEAQEAETSDTILWVIPWEGVPADRWHVKVLEACGACPARLEVGATKIDPFTGEGAVGKLVVDGGRRIWVEPAKREPAIDMFHHGVLSGFWRPRGPIPVSGFVDDPGFSLDASATTVVRNDAFRDANEAVQRAAEDFAVELLAGGWRDDALSSAWVARLRRNRSKLPPRVEEAL
ncbi:MAG: hypothetical protein HY925_04300 [Elusimicrobia bacterium]|nr:hypothetical protein [Elusimicrobiota bacterium]